MLLDLCNNCGKDYKCNGNRCSACHTYYYRHEQERPVKFWRDKPRSIKICRICGLGRVVARGRCKACDNYKRRTRRERPEHLYNPPFRCVNCNEVLKPNKKAGGRCPRCAAYWRYYNRTKERPKKYF